jgi:hypothetical protein
MSTIDEWFDLTDQLNGRRTGGKFQTMTDDNLLSIDWF